MQGGLCLCSVLNFHADLSCQTGLCQGCEWSRSLGALKTALACTSLPQPSSIAGQLTCWGMDKVCFGLFMCSVDKSLALLLAARLAAGAERPPSLRSETLEFGVAAISIRQKIELRQEVSFGF